MDPGDATRLEIYQDERRILRKSFDDQIYENYKNHHKICKPLLEHLASRISYFDRKIEELQVKESKAESEMHEDDTKEGQARAYQKKISECREEAKKIKPRFCDLYELPELKLFNYDGSIDHWIEFWNSFQYIADHPNLSDVEKYGYLSQSTRGDAYDFVKGHSWQIKDFESLMKSFKSRFGSDDKIIRHYMGELLDVMKKAKTNRYQNNLKKYYKDFESIYYKFTGFGLTTKQYSKLLVPLFQETIPTREILLEWYRHKSEINHEKSKIEKIESEKDSESDEEEIFEEMRRFLEIETGSYYSHY